MVIKGTETEELKTPEPEEQQAPDPTEQLKTLQAQIQSLTEERERLDRGYKGLQKTLSEKDRETKKQANLDSRINGLQDTIELLATAIASGGNAEEIEPSQRQDVLAELRKQRTTQEAKRKEEETKQTQQEYAQKADAIYERAKTAFANDDESLERVEDLLMNGRLDRAESRVVKAEGKSNPNKGETEEQRAEKLAQEKFNKYLEERGLLEEYSGLPSAGSGTSQDAMKQYIEGKITADEAKKRGVKFD